MRKICKEFLDNAKPYDTRFILSIGVLSLFIGFGFMATYPYPIVRYLVIVICTIIVAFIKRKYLISIMYMLIDIRKEK